MTPLSWIWLIFIIIFLGLAIFHFIKSRKKIAKFQLTSRPGKGSSEVRIQGSDIDKPLEDFVTGFNNYLDSYNKSTSCQNLLSGFGYFVAAAVAFISMLIELKS